MQVAQEALMVYREALTIDIDNKTVNLTNVEQTTWLQGK